MKQLDGYPADHGYYFPAEWEKHSTTWLTYPSNEESWDPGEIQQVRETFRTFIGIISRGENVCIIVEDEPTRQELLDELAGLETNMANIQTYIQSSNDCWSRDHAPLFLGHRKSGELAAIGFEFNGWGNKYSHELDNRLKWAIIEQQDCDYFRSEMILEGGSVELNGDGLLLTTTSCLLNPNRNPHLSNNEIEVRLKKLLGVHTVLWLDNAIAGDDTDGHIDNMVRFVTKRKVITTIAENKKDDNYMALMDNYFTLEKWAKKGHFDDIISLPMPEPIIHKNDRLPASYANFYICNTGIIVPVFNGKQDDHALMQIQQCFPDKTIYPVDSCEIIKGLGSWHCLSQQVPVFDYKYRAA